MDSVLSKSYIVISRREGKGFIGFVYPLSIKYTTLDQDGWSQPSGDQTSDTATVTDMEYLHSGEMQLGKIGTRSGCHTHEIIMCLIWGLCIYSFIYSVGTGEWRNVFKSEVVVLLLLPWLIAQHHSHPEAQDTIGRKLHMNGSTREKPP